MRQENLNALHEEIKKRFPGDFFQSLLEGSLRVLQDRDNQVRGNLFALGIREMIRHVLEMKSPDDLVKECQWFKDAVEVRRRDKSNKNPTQVTRRDRMIYATQGGISDEMLESLDVNPSEMHRALSQAITDLNKFAHVQPETTLGPHRETEEFAEAVLGTLLGFLENIEDFRRDVAHVVRDTVDTEALSMFMVTTISELDELSTHTQVEDADIEHLEVIDIDPHFVTMKGEGTVYTHLLYGSSSDERRGDGARLREQYPFTMTVRMSTTDFEDLAIGVCDVDTSKFYE